MVRKTDKCENCGHERDNHNPFQGKNMIKHGCILCSCKRFIEIGTKQKEKEAEEYWRNH